MGFLGKHADGLHHAFVFTIWTFVILGIIYIVKEMLK